MAGDVAGRESPGAGSPESTRDTPGAGEALLRTLRTCKLFASVPPAELGTIVAMAQERHIAKRDTVFRQGDRADRIYVIIQGKVKVLLTGPGGRGIILMLAEAGETFGYLDPVAGTARAYTAQAVEESRVLAWPAASFEEILRRYPAVARNALRLTARQLQTDWSRLHDLATEPVARRLARTILRLARARGHHKMPVLAMLQQDVAELLGTTPATLSRILGRWEARGLVTTARERIAVTHPEGLAKIAESHESIAGPIPRRAKRVPSKR
jgi:CRP/FNR family transcriptional regulator, nitrogen oxide reductase regulator